MSVAIRPMTAADVAAATDVQIAAFGALDRAEGVESRPLTEAVMTRLHTRQHHFVHHDPRGAWVATKDGTVVGCAQALKREGLWGLSLLVVDPAVQSGGVGRKLLDASLAYAEDRGRAIILSSADPRAMRAYATSGFTLHPQVAGHGAPDRSSLRADHGRVRTGSADDVDLADEIDRSVRGAWRGPDHVRMATDMPIFVIDDVDGRGYAYVRSDGVVFALAGSDDETATTLLWRCLAHIVELGVAASVDHLNATQQWAVRACYDARLKVTPAGPVFWRGGVPPEAYLPSGAYL